AWTFKDLDHPIFQVIDQRSHDFLAGLEVAPLDAHTERQRWRAGLIFTRGTTAAANFANLAGRRGAPLAAADQTASNLEAFVEEQIELGSGWTLMAGANASINRRTNDQTLGAVPDYTLRYQR